MAFASRRLSSTRVGEGEGRLAARAEQPRPSGTPLGCCRACGAIVYGGDSLAMAGVYVLHGECMPEREGQDPGSPDRDRRLAS